MPSVQSDMSVFHHVSDILELSGPAFFALVYRLPAYGGATRAYLEGWLEDMQEKEAEAFQRAEAKKYPPLYANGTNGMREEVPVQAMTELPRPAPTERVMTLDELAAAAGPAPHLGEFVPVFEVIKLPKE